MKSTTKAQNLAVDYGERYGCDFASMCEDSRKSGSGCGIGVSYGKGQRKGSGFGYVAPEVGLTGIELFVAMEREKTRETKLGLAIKYLFVRTGVRWKQRLFR